MKIVLFESFEENSLNVKYEIMEIRKNGDIEDFFSWDDNIQLLNKINPYSKVLGNSHSRNRIGPALFISQDEGSFKDRAVDV